VYQSCCAPSAAPPLNNAATFLALRLGVTHLHFANLPGNLIEPCPIPLAPILRDFRSKYTLGNRYRISIAARDLNKCELKSTRRHI
jgi:hypothetical protein